MNLSFKNLYKKREAKMNENTKSLFIHYLTEFIIGSIGLGILAILIWFSEFIISLSLISAWVFLFNGVLFTYWIWKSESRIWEKSFAGIYFIIIEIIIANTFTSLSLFV